MFECCLKKDYVRIIGNNITRSLNIFGINKIDDSYCLLSNILALLSKSYFQSHFQTIFYARMGVNTDDNLPLNKPLKFQTLTIIIRCILQEG